MQTHANDVKNDNPLVLKTQINVPLEKSYLGKKKKNWNSSLCIDSKGR
jgi:hypothetical protein